MEAKEIIEGLDALHEGQASIERDDPRGHPGKEKLDGKKVLYKTIFLKECADRDEVERKLSEKKIKCIIKGIKNVTIK